MHAFFNTIHSYNRYLILLSILFVLFRAFSGWLGRKPFDRLDNTAAAVMMGFVHLQLLIGLIQYFFTSAYTKLAFANFGAAMKLPWPRYFAVEHLTGMLLAIVLLQLGRTFSKRASDPVKKHRLLAIYTSLGLLFIIGILAPKGLLFSQLADLVAPAGQ